MKNIIELLKDILTNDFLNLDATIFALGPQYQPEKMEETIQTAPFSLIIGEHPSQYSVSPLMWNAEYNLTERNELFLPADIPTEKQDAFIKLLQLGLELANAQFRVLTITNPYKISAFKFFAKEARNLQDIIIEDDARRIGATNQILIGPDNRFHVINSDGRGMVRSIDSHLASLSLGKLGSGPVALIGAGGAARGIADQLAKRLNNSNGQLHIFNRTLAKAEELINELSEYFPSCVIKAYPLTELEKLAPEYAVIVSAITKGNPLVENKVFSTLKDNTLVVDANYGANSMIMSSASKTNAFVRDGSGMVVEGYIIPSRQIAALWGGKVEEEVYQKIGNLFGYKPL